MQPVGVRVTIREGDELLLDDWHFCVWTNYIDTEKGGTYRALLGLSNLSGQPQAYEVRLFTPG